MSLGAAGCGYEYKKGVGLYGNGGFVCPHLKSDNYCTKYHKHLKTKKVNEFVNNDINCTKTIQVFHPVRLSECGV